MIDLSRAIGRGLHVVGRVWEDWSPFALFVVIVAAVFGLAGVIWVTVASYTGHDWHIFGVYVLSEFLLLAFAHDKTKKIRDFDGEVLVWTIEEITRHSYILDLRDRMLGDALGAAQWGGGIGAGLLIGTVFVVHIVHWRRIRQRRRRAGEKRATLGSRRWIGRRLKLTLHSRPASVRFVWKSITRRAFAGNTKSGEAKPAIGNHHVADAAASDSMQQRRSPVSPAAFNDPTVRPPLAARSEQQDRANVAKAPPGEAHLRFDQRPFRDTHEHSFGAPMSPPLPPAPTASVPAGQSESAGPGRPRQTERKPHPQRQECRDVGASGTGDSAPTESGPAQRHEAAARDGGSDDAASPAPRAERVASADRAPEASGRPPAAGTRLGARRRRRRGSQDFY